MISYNLELCIGKDIDHDIFIKQNDTGAQLNIKLLESREIVNYVPQIEEFEIPAGAYAQLRIAKPDITSVVVDDITITGNVMTVSLTEQATAAAGKAKAEISVYDSNMKRLTSADFRIVILPAAVADRTIISSDYYDILARQIAATIEAEGNAKQSEDNAAGQAGIAAGHAADAEEQAGIAAGHAAAAEQQAGIAEGYAGDALSQANRAKEQADRAEGEADRAESEADRAGNNILNGVATHNEEESSHPFLLSEQSRIEAIARGKANSKVFNTYADMTAWLADPEHVAELNIGDNLYIEALDVPDYWWNGEEPKQLEAEAPRLVDYYTKIEVDNRLPISIEQTDYDALVAAGTVIAGRIYYVVPDGTLGGD